jgi:hypothetical protein
LAYIFRSNCIVLCRNLKSSLSHLHTIKSIRSWLLHHGGVIKTCSITFSMLPSSFISKLFTSLMCKSYPRSSEITLKLALALQMMITSYTIFKVGCTNRCHIYLHINQDLAIVTYWTIGKNTVKSPYLKRDGAIHGKNFKIPQGSRYWG